MNQKSQTIILGLESSCDETAVAILKVKNDKFSILSNIVLSQIKIHRPYGGVVPELAARNHIKNILPVITQALTKARLTPGQIDKIAVTTGPGLITSLIVGTQTAKTLAYVWHKPLVSVNHLKAHIYANWLPNQPIKFPAVGLIVSGGHTEIILIKNEKNFKKIGQTLDDAAGESFDKVAQLLNLGYPGGPIISRLAQTGKSDAFKLPRPMIDKPDFNFSFAGLKTAVLYTVQKLKTINYQTKTDLCASFQQAAIDVLVKKTVAAAEKFKAKTIMISGGVAANPALRQQLQSAAMAQGQQFMMPLIEFCTDNAAMVAAAGYFENPTPWQKIKADPNLEIK